MKRAIALFLCICLGVGLVACATDTSDPTPAPATPTPEGTAPTTEDDPPPPAPVSDDPVTLSFYYWNEPQKEIIDLTIAMFNEIYPHITIETTVIPWGQYWDTMMTVLPTGAGPDIFHMNGPNAVDYIPAGMLLPLDDFIARDGVDMSLYAPGITALYNFNGVQYAMPKDYDSIGLLYNKAMFDDAGLSYPDDSWTWDDLLEAALALTTGSQYGFTIDSWMQTGLGNFIFQNGGQIFSADSTSSAINSPQNIETLQYLADMIHVHGVSPTNAELTETPSYVLFQAEQVAMITFGSWYVGTLYDSLGEKMGVAPLPQKVTRATMLHGLGNAISHSCEHPDEAWAFIRFLSEREAMLLQSSVVLPAYMGMEDAWVAKLPGLDARIFPEAARYGVPLPVAAFNSAMVDQAMYEALDAIWNGTASVEEALAQAEADMNAAFAG